MVSPIMAHIWNNFWSIFKGVVWPFKNIAINDVLHTLEKWTFLDGQKRELFFVRILVTFSHRGISQFPFVSDFSILQKHRKNWCLTPHFVWFSDFEKVCGDLRNCLLYLSESDLRDDFEGVSKSQKKVVSIFRAFPKLAQSSRNNAVWASLGQEQWKKRNQNPLQYWSILYTKF